MNSLGNLKLLTADMEEKGWIIDSFRFSYKQVDYIVLVTLYVSGEIKPQHAILAKLVFLNEKDNQHRLEAPATSYGLIIDAKTLREFFRIDYTENLGDILRQFTACLGRFIPTKVTDDKTPSQKEAMEKSLSLGDSEDPEKKYCYKVKRNGKKEDGTPKCRTLYNDNITRLRRPKLYEELGKDPTLSFCYSKRPDDEKIDEEIISNWTNNK